MFSRDKGDFATEFKKTESFLVQLAFIDLNITFYGVFMHCISNAIGPVFASSKIRSIIGNFQV